MNMIGATPDRNASSGHIATENQRLITIVTEVSVYSIGLIELDLELFYSYNQSSKKYGACKFPQD